MVRVSTAAATLLVFVFLLGSISYAENQPWPLKGRIDLSSGFGDYRLNRFHAGIDLRTGGRIGKPVYSPVNGSVWRVKMSYNGYGKGLYIKGDDGHIYVFGHLSALSEKIDRTVKEAQNRAQRYYVDLNLLQDSIPIKKGEQIALSGQTGVGAPHLHFEKRSSNNQPLNPLEHGFKLNDKVRPTFERIGFQLTDDRSLFPDGSRTLRVDVVKAKAGLYSTDTVPYLSSPFGVLVDCFDQMRTGSMRQSIHRLTLSIDGRPVYESVFDSLKFEIGPSVQLEFDHVSAAAGEKRIRRLFHVPGNEYFGSGGESNGIIGADSSLSDGVHEGLIEAEDSFGNKARLEFRFMWGPEGESRSESADLGVRETQSLGYTLLDQGLVLSLDGGSDKDSVGRVMVHYRNTAGSPGGIGGSRGWAVTPASAGHVFVTCQSIYNQVHYVEVSPDFRRPHQSPFGVKVNVSAVGYQDHTMLSNDSLFSVHTTRETFYEPRFLALENAEAPATPGLVSNCYRILPDAFVTTQPFEVELKVDPKAIGVRSKQAGLCWRDEKENEWVWINEFYEDDTTSGLTTSAVPPEPRGYYPSGTSLGGGMFAVLIDTTAPTIANLSVKAGLTYKGLKPTIEFILKDTLSGIKDDRFIDARINGRWLIPEYEPEESRCRVYPYEPLPAGRCELMIVVEDRAGNVAEHRVDFFVKE